ncbi:hypothetical protein ACFLQK_02540 [bacterium]
MPEHSSAQDIETASPVSFFSGLKIQTSIRAIFVPPEVPRRGASSFETTIFYRTNHRNRNKNATGREPGAPVCNLAGGDLSVFKKPVPAKVRIHCSPDAAVPGRRQNIFVRICTKQRRFPKPRLGFIGIFDHDFS